MALKVKWVGWRWKKPSGPAFYENEADQEIVGVKEAVFYWRSNGWGNSTLGSGGGFTLVTFDTTTYSDGAIIKIQNTSGSQRRFQSAHINGKPILRYSGEKGLVHDDFVDYESIARDGEKKLEFGNNYIVTKNQLESLCDHYWKASNYKRHIYKLEIPGRCYWYCPGEWYTVQVGGAGQAEYIDSVCECFDVQIESEAGGIGRTIVCFREIYQNWVKDSGAIARFLGSGSLKDKHNFSRLLVASPDYPGPSDYRCDGTDDQVEIQEAISQLQGAGGVVELTEGTFNTTAAIDLSYDNIVLTGAGAKTIIEKNCNDYGIKVAGSDGSEIENVWIQNLKIQASDSDTNANKPLIWMSYADKTYLMRVIATNCYTSSYGAIYLSHCDNCAIEDSESYENMASGFAISECSKTIIHDCISHHNGSSGISVWGAGYTHVFNNYIYNNIISGITVILGSEDCVIENNKIENNVVNNLVLRNAAVSVPAASYQYSGIYIAVNAYDTQVRNNNCKDNGSQIDGYCESTTPPAIEADAYSLSGCTSERSTAEYYAGSYSHKITQTDASTGEYRFCDNVTKNDLHGLYPNTQYKLSAYVYRLSTGSPTTAEVKLIVGYTTDAAGAWHETTGNISTESDAWALAETTNVNLANAVGAKALIRINAAASTDEYIFIDNVRLQPIGTHNLHSQNFYDAGSNTYIGV